MLIESTLLICIGNLHRLKSFDCYWKWGLFQIPKILKMSKIKIILVKQNIRLKLYKYHVGTPNLPLFYS